MKKQIQLLALLSLLSTAALTTCDMIPYMIEQYFKRHPNLKQHLVATNEALIAELCPVSNIDFNRDHEPLPLTPCHTLFQQHLKQDPDLILFLRTPNRWNRTPFVEAKYHTSTERYDHGATTASQKSILDIYLKLNARDRKEMRDLVTYYTPQEQFQHTNSCLCAQLEKCITKVGNTTKTVACNIVNDTKKKITKKLKKAERFAENHRTVLEKHMHALGQDFENLNT